ncbi:MAG TPA: PPC domain-containing protein [Gemmataceae bacterium]|jgi:hypothetical protein|nr:PPC domain-containing protein [Gemmataceae bacterium]
MRRPLALLLLALLPLPLFGQPKMPATAGGPKIVVAIPLGVKPGATTRLTLRGLKLDAATEVRCQEPKASAKLLKKGGASVPNQQDVNRVGNTEAQVEVTLPPDYPARTVTVTVLTPAGESLPHALLVDRGPVVAEKEPNNGFREAQPLAAGQEVQGAISQNQDVDVYRFEGKAGQHVVAEVLAARYGSALDSFLTLYDGEGRILASNDDSGGGPDSRVELRLPRDGAYFLSVIDANDQGGPAHVYRLSLRLK